MKNYLLFPDFVLDSKSVPLTHADDSMATMKDFPVSGILPLVLIKGSLILKNHFGTLRIVPPAFKKVFLTFKNVSLTFKKDSLTFRNVLRSFRIVPPAFRKDSLTLRNVLQSLVEVWWCFEWGYSWFGKLFSILRKVFLKSAGLFRISEELFLNSEELFLTSRNHLLTSGNHFLISRKTAAMKGSGPNPYIHLRSPPGEQ